MRVRPLELILCCSDPKRNYLCCFCSVTNLKEKDEREREAYRATLRNFVFKKQKIQGKERV